MIHALKLIVDGDNYTFQEIVDPENVTEEEWLKWQEENDPYLFDDEENSWDDLFVLKYVDDNGKSRIYPYIHTWRELEEEFEDELVQELKKNRDFIDYEYGECSYDDRKTEWHIITPNIIKL